MHHTKTLLIIMLATWLGACSSHRPFTGGVFEEQDRAPSGVRDWHNIPDAQPKWEPKARYGNHSPYRVLGKTYYVMESSKGYRETGYGSWYGEKFAGRPTSSQEPYDPYAMTAAHKSLPLPSYVRVTNLENNKQIIVRVNDRGPFHDGRIIDLSYAAAHKIGYANKGTARVLVEAIDPAEFNGATPQITPRVTQQPASTNTIPETLPNEQNTEQFYLQVGAYKNLSTAKNLQQELIALTNAPVGIYSQPEAGSQNVHRVRIGPFDNEQAAQQVKQQIQHRHQPLIIKR